MGHVGFLTIGVIFCCLSAFGCAKTKKVENAEIEELKKRQSELEASQGRVLQELDRLRKEILVLEEAVNLLKEREQIKGEWKQEPSRTKQRTIETKKPITTPIEYEIEELKKAESLINSGRAAEAIFLLLDAESKIKTDKDRCQLDFLVARAYHELTEWQQALKWAESVDKSACRELIPKARFIKIESLVKLNRSAEAKKVLNSLLTEYPNSEEAEKAEKLF